MVWSNQIPPNIIIQQDGTTVFTGGLKIQAPDGSTAANIDTSGQLNAKSGQIGTLQVTAPNQQGLYDVGQKLYHLPAGMVATVQHSGDSVTINDSTGFLMLLTNQFTLDTARAYRFSSNAMRVALGNPQNGDLFVFKLVLYSSYPTPSNYTTAFQTLDGIVWPVQPNNNFWGVIPSLHFESYPGALNGGSTMYLGLYAYRVGTAITTLKYSAALPSAGNDNGPVELCVEDLGIPSFIAPGVINPMGYQGTVQPAPAVQHQQAFPATWSQSYDSDSGGNAFYGGTSHMYQGDVDAAGGSGHGIEFSACNFDYATLGSILNGAQNVTMYLNFYCEHTWYNSGMNYQIFSHNTRTGSAPGNQSGIVGPTNQFSGSVTAPGWLSIQVPQSIWGSFITGNVSGFGFYVNSTDLSYYGYFAGATEGSNAPYIALYWTK